jgi:anti-anti-sigma factor
MQQLEFRATLPDPPLVVEIENLADVLTISLRGEIDLATAPLVAHSLDGVDLTAWDAIVVDADGVRFIDCAGVVACLVLAGHASRAAVPFAIINVLQGPAKVFHLTGNGHLLDRTDPSEWRPSFRSGSPLERLADPVVSFDVSERLHG